MVDVVHNCAKNALADSLPTMEKQFRKLEEEFDGDGIMAVAIRGIVEVARRALALRAARPFFELDWIEEIENGNVVLNDILRRMPSCAVLQMNVGSEDEIGRDWLLSFLAVDGDSGKDPEQGLRVVHSIFDYLGRHCDPDGFLPTSMVEKRRCPFYTSCDLALRRVAPSICKSTPWKSADWSGWEKNGACWYAVGIRVTRQPADGDRVFGESTTCM